jgi:voltage-gated potassium channel
LGVKRGEETLVNPPQPFRILQQDQLIVILG